jgi:hypothetical protein
MLSKIGREVEAAHMQSYMKVSEMNARVQNMKKITA